MASGTVVFLAPNGANQDGQGIPGAAVTQPPGMIQYVGQQFGSLRRPLQQNLQVGPMEKFLNVAKTLGAIQIIIGLIHIGLGGVLAAVWGQARFISIAVIGGYVFWGSLFGDGRCKWLHTYARMLAQGRHVVAKSPSEHAQLPPVLHSSQHNGKRTAQGLGEEDRRVKTSVGMNILSAIMALTGSILLIVDLLLFTLSSCTYDCDREYECYMGRQPVVFVPYTVSGGVVAPSDHCPPPLPAYNVEDPFPK
nr:membrane-spanning 4-domains subfamily A member 15-like [Anolis sagrei ordinatus]